MKYLPLLNIMILFLIPALIRHGKEHTALIIYIQKICEVLKIDCTLKE